MTKARNKVVAWLHKGFTLVELLVAVVILSLIAVLLSGLVGQLVKMTQFSNAQSQRLEKAGTALDLIRRDLSGAILPLPNDAQDSLQFLSGSDVLNISDAVKNPHGFFWQAPVAADSSGGDLAVVGYFIRWDTSQVGQPRARLCRLKIDSADFAAKGIDFSKPWLTNQLLDDNAFGKFPEYSGFVVDDVIALWVKSIAIGGSASYEFDSRATSKLPSCLEIAMVVLDDRAAAAMTNIPDYSALDPEQMNAEITEFIAALPPRVREGARIFRTIVKLDNAF